jgi:hypothetical protein
VGFGSFSDRKDGGIALWNMQEIENEEMEESELSVVSVPAPSYHWLGYDGHTGGVGCLHLDRYQGGVSHNLSAFNIVANIVLSC